MTGFSPYIINRWASVITKFLNSYYNSCVCWYISSNWQDRSCNFPYTSVSWVRVSSNSSSYRGRHWGFLFRFFKKLRRQWLRAAGFYITKSIVLDILIDLTIHYLQLLASQAAFYTRNNHNDFILDIANVQLALIYMESLRPQLSIMEEQSRGEKDIKGINDFLN